MPERDLVRRSGRLSTPEVLQNTEHPFFNLWERINNLFDDVARTGVELTGREPYDTQSLALPRVDVDETKKAIEVTAELPGMTRRDIHLSLSSTNDALLLRGEKKAESKREDTGVYHAERYYGVIERAIPLPCVVEPGSVEASFKDGVLKVTLPKCQEHAHKAKRIPVKTA